MAAAESAGIDVEGFKFVSFKEQSEDCRKITRKRHLLNLEAKGFYPPEGHVCFSGGFTEETDEEYSEKTTKMRTVRMIKMTQPLNQVGKYST